MDAWMQPWQDCAAKMPPMQRKENNIQDEESKHDRKQAQTTEYRLQPFVIRYQIQDIEAPEM